MSTNRSWSFLIVAGGSGKRLGGTPKQFRVLGGIPVWQWSLRIAETLLKNGEICDIVLVVPDEHIKNLIDVIGNNASITVTAGGAERQNSVMNGLLKCKGDFVLIHDGARPFISTELCRSIMAMTDYDCAVVPLVRISDAIKKIDGKNMLSADRDSFRRTQTPQAFCRESLINILKGSEYAHDDASSWINSGRRICYVDGEERNFKITTQFDWELAAAMANNKVFRTGAGYDIHQLVQDRKLILAGIEVENGNIGLLGHSDADVVTHAVMDAILGAAGEPDIGTIFPANDDKWLGADSIKLLHAVIEHISSRGWQIEWVDAVLIAQKPKLGHLIPLFIDKLNKELGALNGKKLFNMKVKSGEHCGSVGRGECMICHVSATLSHLEFND